MWSWQNEGETFNLVFFKSLKHRITSLETALGNSTYGVLTLSTLVNANVNNPIILVTVDILYFHQAPLSTLVKPSGQRLMSINYF